MTRVMLTCFVVFLGGCDHGSRSDASSRPQAPPAPVGSVVSPGAQHEHFVLTGGRIPGRGPVDLEIDEGRIVSLGDPAPDPDLPRVDVTGRVLVPALVDSHVHLAYRFGDAGREQGAQQLAASGLGAVVDLAAPVDTLSRGALPLELVASGPMITAPGGYPTQSWGYDGYGREIGDSADAREAVRALHEAGAGVVKLAMHGEPSLSEPELRAVVEEAHGLGLRVVAHALGDAEVALAARVEVDALAHTPLGPLSPETVEAWSGRAVVSTLAAFGGGSVAVDNLRRLHEAGAVVLYGSDLGNPGFGETGVSAEELELLMEVGLDGEEVLAAATSEPVRWWSLQTPAVLEVGAPASLLVLDEDPYVDPTTLARAEAVYLGGIAQRDPDA